MADLDLRVDYQDDILDASVNTKRKYNIIENADGTKSLEDVSVYTQTGDTFGAVDVNKTNQAILDLNQSLTIDFSNSTATSLNQLLQYVADNFFPIELDLLATYPTSDDWQLTKYLQTNSSFSMSNGKLTLTDPPVSGLTYNRMSSVASNEKVDLTSYSKLKVELSRTESSATVYLALWSSSVSYEKPALILATLSSGTSNYSSEIDISDYNGEYYIGLNINSGSGFATTVEMTECKLTP